MLSLDYRGSFFQFCLSSCPLCQDGNNEEVEGVSTPPLYRRPHLNRASQRLTRTHLACASACIKMNSHFRAKALCSLARLSWKTWNSGGHSCVPFRVSKVLQYTLNLKQLCSLNSTNHEPHVSWLASNSLCSWADLELPILSSLPSQWGYCWYLPTCPDYTVLGLENRTLCVLGKHPTY